MPVQTVNPYTNETIKEFPEISNQDLQAALEQAVLGFQSWRQSAFDMRSALLQRVAGLMRERQDELAATITLEMGKLIDQSYGEINLSANILDYYAENGEDFLADTTLVPQSGEAFIRYSPLGPLLGVMPWNFPFYQVARFAGPNLMAGNTILIKHASNVPQCAQLIADLFREAGAPPGIYTNLFLSGSRVADLVADNRIKGTSLTGSDAAGASLAEAAGKNIKKSLLELGGSDPFIVLEDADLDKTVDWAVIGRMNNTGQSCVASKRFIVVAAVADAFLEKFKDKLSRLQAGDPMDPNTTLGPLSSEQAAQQLIDQIQRSVDAGAKVILGGKRIDRPGAFVEATILTDIKPQVPAYREELFGPVASFFRVKDEQAAIELANDSPYGLGGAVFTRDVERGKKVADQLETGMVFINHPTGSEPGLPFGGIKRSGYGRELSPLGIKEFVNKKLIRVADIADPSHGFG